MLKLKGWGLRPWMEFEIDPLSGRYTRRRVQSENTSPHGYAGFGQELSFRRLGITLCSVFVHDADIVLRVGDATWSLFQPGLEVTHREGLWFCELHVNEAAAKQTTFRYRRTDTLLVFLDSTYDELDFELANLPANVPLWSQRDKGEIVAEWSAKAARPASGAEDTSQAAR